MNTQIGQRHREVRENRLAMTVSDYAQAVGVKDVTVYSWESGRTKVPAEIIIWLWKNHAISTQWMMTGEGAMGDVEQTKQEAPSTTLLKDVQRQVRELQTVVKDLQQNTPHVLAHAAGAVQRRLAIPMLSLGVSAGSPAVSDDTIEREIDLAEMLLEHPESTYFIRVVGDSMQDAGISDGDTLIVDCAVQPKNGHVVIAKIYGELTVKRYITENGVPMLKAENALHKDIHITEDMDFSVVGVVRSCIKQL
jgi:DNA polymerase V